MRRDVWVWAAVALSLGAAAGAAPPTLAVIDPVAPPRPMPGPADPVRLEAGRFELLRLTGYAGKVTWRAPAAGPVAVYRLKPKAKVRAVPLVPAPPVEVADAGTVLQPGLKAGAAAGGLYDVGDDPAVLLYPVPGRTGRVTVEAFGVDADGFPVVLTELVVVVGPDAPDPAPEPPTPDPAPAPGGPVKFVVIVEETQDAVAGRGAFFASPQLAERARAKGVKWRVVDKDVVGADGKPPADVARFLSLAAGKPYPSVFLVDAAGKLIDQRPVPRTPADLLTLLGQFGG